MEIVEESPYRFVIPRHGRMRVPGVVFATRALIPDPAADRSLQQVVNVAELPGIAGPRMRCPMCTGVTDSRSAGSRRPMSPVAVWSRRAVSVSTSRAACACLPPIWAGTN